MSFFWLIFCFVFEGVFIDFGMLFGIILAPKSHLNIYDFFLIFLMIFNRFLEPKWPQMRPKCIKTSIKNSMSFLITKIPLPGVLRAPKWSQFPLILDAISRPGDSKNRKDCSLEGEMYWKINKKINAFLDRENVPPRSAQGTKMAPKWSQSQPKWHKNRVKIVLKYRLNGAQWL